MADNVGYTPGSGATVAADEIGGVLYQRVKPVTGLDGTAVDVSATNPMPMAAYGELIEAVEALRMAISAIARNMPIPDSGHRVRAILDTNTNIQNVNGSVASVSSVSSVSNITTVATVTTCSSLTNVANVGNIGAYAIAASILFSGASQLRNNITVS